MGRIQLGFYIRNLTRASEMKEWYLIGRNNESFFTEHVGL